MSFTESLFPELPNPYRMSAQSVANLIMGDVYFVSDWERIGAHDWAFVIYRHQVFGWVTSCYVWRRAADHGRALGAWSRDEDFPTYDKNKADGGLPRSLRVLWHRAAEARAQHGLM